MGADSSGELHDLFPDVGGEGVRASAANRHDGVDGLLGKVHKPGETPVHGMEPHDVGGQPKDVLFSA